MAIKELLILEGGEQVKQALQDYAKAGENFVNTLNQLGTGASKSQLTELVDSFQKAPQAVGGATSSVHEFRNALYILRPILAEAGIHLGQFGMLARLAGTGMAGILIALGGAALLGLGKFADGIELSQKRLAGLTGSTQGGKDLFRSLQEGAQQLGVSVKDLQGPTETMISDWEAWRAKSTWFRDIGAEMDTLRRKTAEGIDASQKAFITDTEGIERQRLAAKGLEEVLMRGGATSEQAAAAANQLARAMRDNAGEMDKFGNTTTHVGSATGAMLRQLRETAGAGAVQELGKAFGYTTKNAEAFIAEVDKADLRAEHFGETLAKIGRSAPDRSKEIGTVTQELNRLGVAAERAVEDVTGLSGGKIAGGFLRGLGDVISENVRGMNNLTGAVAKVVAGVQSAAKGGGGIFDQFFPPSTQGNIKEASVGIDQLDRSFQSALPNISSSARAFDFLSSIARGAIPSLDALDGALEKTPEITAETPSTTLYDTIIDKAKEAIQFIDELIRKQSQVQSGAGLGAGGGGVFAEVPMFASGGLFRGRGGVDTNLAWLSDLEYIINPSAVKKYGAGFLDLINSMRFPIRGFAAGGLNITPRISTSSVQSNRTFTLALDTRRFNISGSKSTIDALEREAALRGLASTGIAPGWVR